MARTPELSNLAEAVEQVAYKPLPKDHEAKARFWQKSADDPFAASDVHQTRANAERLVGHRITNWDKPGFQDWFFNRDEHRHKLEYLFALALEAAGEILVNTDPKVQGARVQMIKAIADLAGKTPRQSTNIQINSGNQIANMDRAALESYIRAEAAKLPAPIDIVEEGESV